MSATDGPRPQRSFDLLVAAALAGAGTMVVELSAVRLLAPFFGTSQAVWTNVIGVVLFALSIGYLLGARLSRTQDPRRMLGVALLVGGLLSALLPFAVGPVVGLFRPERLALHEAAALLTWGSLATSVVLFALPAAALGCAAPLCVEALQSAAQRGAGDAGGRVLCVSTLGSLIGTFATSHWLVPQLGLRWSFLSAAFVLMATGTFLVAGRGRVAGFAALVLVGALLAPRDVNFLPSPAPGVRLLEQRSSVYQELRVMESGEADGRFRTLEVNEGFDSFQSVWQPEAGLLPMGYYYNAFALPLALEERESWRVLVLGAGAGTTQRVLSGLEVEGEPRVEFFGIELDPDVVDLGRRYFDLVEDGAHHVYGGLDARAGLLLAQLSDEPFDEIVLDAYANQVEVPAHLATTEFFSQLRERLRQGGWLVANVGAFGLDDPVLSAIAYTLASAFERDALAIAVPFSRNVALLVRRGADVPTPGADNVQLRVAGLSRLWNAASLPGRWRSFSPDGPMSERLTDDRSDLELRQRRSLELAQAVREGAR